MMSDSAFDIIITYFADEKYTILQDTVNWDNYWNPKLFIENAVGEPKLSLSKNVECNELGEAWVTERKRYKGTYMETLELWEFPFDVQVFISCGCE